MTACTAESVGRKGVAEYLRNSYADARAKRIARDLNVSPGQAERYLAAKSCPSWLLFSMAKTHGWDFVREVFEPLCGPTDDDKRVAQERAHREANKEFIREALREAVGEIIGPASSKALPSRQLGGELDRDAGGVAGGDRPKVAQRAGGSR